MSKFNKSHSPARALIYQEVLKSSTLKRIKRKSVKNESKELSLESETKVEGLKIYFRPKMFNDAFLVEPNEINQLINLTRIRRNTTKALIGKKKKDEKVARFEGERKKLVKFQQFYGNSNTSLKYFQVVKAGNAKELRELLSKDSGLVQLTESVGMTGLHWAAKRNQMKIANILISYGCPISTKDIFGRTALDIAKKFNYPELIHLFSSQTMKNEMRDSLKESTLKELTPLQNAKV
jgi:hypothetical protein